MLCLKIQYTKTENDICVFDWLIKYWRAIRRDWLMERRRERDWWIEREKKERERKRERERERERETDRERREGEREREFNGKGKLCYQMPNIKYTNVYIYV